MRLGQGVSTETSAALVRAIEELSDLGEHAIAVGAVTEASVRDMLTFALDNYSALAAAGFPEWDTSTLLSFVRARVDYLWDLLGGREPPEERSAIWALVVGGIVAAGAVGVGIWYATRGKPRRGLAAPWATR